MARITRWFSFAAAFSLAAAALGQPFTVEDFDPSPLAGHFMAGGTDFGFGDPEVDVSIVPGGNPGNAVQLEAELTMGQSLAILNVSVGGDTWDAAALGPIQQLDFRADVRGFSIPGATFGSTIVYEFQLRNLDDPTVFYKHPTATATLGSTWTTLVQTGLTAEDFTPALGGDEHPNLSIGRWRFHVAIAASRPSGGTWGGRYLVDNIAINVTAPPPPSGPRVLLHAPSREPDDVLYARAPISTIQIAFDQPVNFTDADVTLTSAASGSIAGAVISGTGTPLMQIDLPAGIANDAVTVTLGAGITGVHGGLSLDGDGDGTAGDPHTFTLRHLCLADVDDSSATDVFDLLAYLDAWFEGCP